MSFEEFLEAARQRVQEEIPDAEVKIQKVEKLQQESYTGISVRPKDSSVAATFNVLNAYESCREDPGELKSVLEKLVSDVLTVTSSMPVFSAGSIMDYETAKEHLTMQAIPVKPNEQMLEDIPHKTVEDIAIVYRVELPNLRNASATTLVTNRLLEEYGITKETLHDDAVKSVMKNHPPVLKNMSEMMTEMSDGMIDMPESPMWVATIEGGIQGASVVQIPAFMDEAAKRLGGDYFVLPSSIHEVLLVKDNGEFSRQMLEDMVRGVNSTEVSASEFLSDSVYHYDSEGHVFEKAATFEGRVAEEKTPYGQEKDTYTVLLVEPKQYPRPVEIGTGLKDLQEAVDGYIEAAYPFEDPVALIMNEEGKLEGLPLNRALRDENGSIYDVIAGPFLVVGLSDDGFQSLTPEQMKKYEKHFHQPEVFIKTGKGIMAINIPDEAVGHREEKGRSHRKKTVEATL